MARRFFVVDVFAEEKYAGNQLAVVLDAGDLEEARDILIAALDGADDKLPLLSELVQVEFRRGQRDEARRYLEHYVRDKGDWETAQKMVSMFGLESGTLDAEVLEEFKFHFIAGHGGYPMVGTPEQIVAQMQSLASMGVDGLLLSWVDYIPECQQWIDEVLPLMEQAGLREPVSAGPREAGNLAEVQE